MKTKDEEVLSVFREVDWYDVIPKILLLTRAELYKKKVFSFHPLSWKIPEDYVNEAITLLLNGTRVWNYKEVPLLQFLQGTISGLISHDIERAVKEIKTLIPYNDDSTFEGISDTYHVKKNLEEDVATEELLTQLRQTLETDDIGIRIIELVLLDGLTKPRDLAEALDVPVSEIYNAKKRLRRTLLIFRERLVNDPPIYRE